MTALELYIIVCSLCRTVILFCGFCKSNKVSSMSAIFPVSASFLIPCLRFVRFFSLYSASFCPMIALHGERSGQSPQSEWHKSKACSGRRPQPRNRRRPNTSTPHTLCYDTSNTSGGRHSPSRRKMGRRKELRNDTNLKPSTRTQAGETNEWDDDALIDRERKRTHENAATPFQTYIAVGHVA